MTEGKMNFEIFIMSWKGKVENIYEESENEVSEKLKLLGVTVRTREESGDAIKQMNDVFLD